MAGVKYLGCDFVVLLGTIFIYLLVVILIPQTPIYHVSFENFFKGNLQQFNAKLSSEILRHFTLLAEKNADKATYNGWQANGINQVVLGVCVLCLHSQDSFSWFVSLVCFLLCL